MGKFIGMLVVEVPVNDCGTRYIVGTIWYELSPDLAQKVGYTRIEVPAGFLTDYASVPRILWNLIPPTGKYTYAAVVHDYLYAGHNGQHIYKVTRKQADAVFLDAMLSVGVSKPLAYTMWAGVRVGGWVGWGRSHPKT